MLKSFRYRLYPNKTQKNKLNESLETHRRLYNQALELRISTYREQGKSLSYVDQCKWFTGERKLNKWYREINCDSGMYTLLRLDRTYKNFFRRLKSGEKVGFPRFKGAGRFSSFDFSPDNGAKLIKNRIRLQHIGNVKINLHRELEGEIRTTTISVEDGKWFVSFNCEVKQKQIGKSTLPAIGIDVGLTHFLTTSNGEKIDNPRFLKRDLPEIKRRSRSVSRKKKGSKNRRKAVKRLRSLHTKVRNRRRDFHHKLSLDLVRRFGFIAVERLNITAMQQSKKPFKNHRLNRSISDVGWANFRGILKYKAESAGVQVVEVDPAYTSQECSQCGKLVPKDLSVRQHVCSCGCRLDRDHNAALVILARALALIGPAEPNQEVTLDAPRTSVA